MSVCRITGLLRVAARVEVGDNNLHERRWFPKLLTPITIPNNLQSRPGLPSGPPIRLNLGLDHRIDVRVDLRLDLGLDLGLDLDLQRGACLCFFGEGHLVLGWGPGSGVWYEPRSGPWSRPTSGTPS